MAVSAGQINIGMSVFTGRLTKGIKSARKSVNGFAKSFNPLNSGLGRVALGIGASVVALGSLQNVISSTTKAFADIDRLGKFSAAVGISIDALRGLQLGAELSGTSVQTLQKSLTKLTRNIGDAQQGFGDGKRAIEAMGFSLNEISALSTEDQFAKIAQGISELETPAQQASAAAALLGRAGIEMLPMLQAGEAGIRGFIDEAKNLGGSVSRLDVAQIELANDSITKLNFAFESIWQQIAIKVAPVVLALATKLTEAGSNGFDMAQAITTGFNFVVDAMGVVADVIDVIHDAFLALKAGVTKLIALQVNQWAMLGRAIESVVNLLPGVEVSFTDTLTAIGKDLDKLASEQWAEAKDAFMAAPPSEGIKAWFDDVEQKSKEAAQAIADNAAGKAATTAFLEANKSGLDLLDKLNDQLTHFGLEGRQLEIAKLEVAGVDPAIIEQVKELDAQLSKLESQREIELELQGLSEQIIQDTTAPLKQLADTVAKYQQLLDAGAIGQDQFAKATDQLKQKLLGIDIDGTPIEQYQARLDELQSALHAGVISIEQFNQAEIKAKSEILDIQIDATPLEQYKTRLAELQTALDKGLITKVEFDTAKLDAMPDRAKQIIEDTKSPFDKLNDQIQELNELKIAGLIDEDQFNRQLGKMAKDLSKELGISSEIKLAGKAEVGSAEARDAIIRNRLQLPDAKLDLERTQIQILQKQADLLADIAAKDDPVFEFNQGQDALDMGNLPTLDAPTFGAIPVDEMPEVRAPELPKLDFNKVELPEITIDAPQIALDAPRLPQMSFDTLETPSLPSLSVEPIQTPQLDQLQSPQLQTPRLGQLQSPKLDELQAPALPQIALDAPRLPQMSFAPLDAPQMQSPRIDQLQSPQLDQLQSPQLPSFEIPDLPILSVDEPELNLPTSTRQSKSDGLDKLQQVQKDTLAELRTQTPLLKRMAEQKTEIFTL